MAGRSPALTVSPAPPLSLTQVGVSLASSNKSSVAAGSTGALDDDDKVPRKEADASPANQLRIDFSVMRIAAITALAVGLVVTILVILGNGVRLSSFASTEKTDVERKQLLDKYNSWFGNLMSAIIKLIDMALELLVAVSLLCLAAKWIVRESSLLASVAPSLLVAGLSFLVCNGPTSVNVQLVPEALHVRMVAKDLVSRGADDQPTAANGSLITPWNQSFAESAPNNSVLNTVLRTRLIPYKNLKARCTYNPVDEDPPTVMFGFSSVDWIVDALPTALEPEQTFTLLPDDPDAVGQLPMEADTARTLFVTTMYQLYARLGAVLDTSVVFSEFLSFSRDVAIDKWAPNTSTDEIINLGDIMDFAGDNFVAVSREMLQGMFASTWNVVPDDLKADYHTFRIADYQLHCVDPDDSSKTARLRRRDSSDSCVVLFGRWVSAAE